jgi:hypothetical protein
MKVRAGTSAVLVPCNPSKEHRVAGTPITVHNSSFALSRLAADCDPLQFLRELTQNALEALDGPGEVVWGVDRWTLEAQVAPKLCVYDTGCGMTGKDLAAKVGQLFSSGHTQGLTANFGVGAKIAVLPSNPHGVVYQSWRDGEGAKLCMYRDGDEWSIRTWGAGELFTPVGLTEAPPAIQRAGHGTLVTLLGTSAEDDTTRRPDGAGHLAATSWLVKYLNSRYLELPSGSCVRAARTDGSDQSTRTLVGQRAFLDENADASGLVDLIEGGLTARWWVLKEDVARRHASYHNASGHIAFILDNELYEVSAPGNASYARLRNCGVSFGYQRVVIYFALREGNSATLISDTARSRLRLDGDSLPWDRIEEAFLASLPAELKTHVEASAPRTSSTDLNDALKTRLGPVLTALGIERYRPDANGAECGSHGGGLPGGVTRTGANEAGGGAGASGPDGGRAGTTDTVSGTDTAVRRVANHAFPQIQWLREADGTRTPEDLVDRAASWDRVANRILVNGDFRGFTSVEAYWNAQASGRAGAETTIRATLEMEVSLALAEAVLSARSLQANRTHWNGEHRDTLLSDEALTLVAMQRRGLQDAITAAFRKMRVRREAV